MFYNKKPNCKKYLDVKNVKIQRLYKENKIKGLTSEQALACARESIKVDQAKYDIDLQNEFEYSYKNHIYTIKITVENDYDNYTEDQPYTILVPPISSYGFDYKATDKESRQYNQKLKKYTYNNSLYYRFHDGDNKENIYKHYHKQGYSKDQCTLLVRDYFKNRVEQYEAIKDIGYLWVNIEVFIANQLLGSDSLGSIEDNNIIQSIVYNNMIENAIENAIAELPNTIVDLANKLNELQNIMNGAY